MTRVANPPNPWVRYDCDGNPPLTVCLHPYASDGWGDSVHLLQRSHPWTHLAAHGWTLDTRGTHIRHRCRHCNADLKRPPHAVVNPDA